MWSRSFLRTDVFHLVILRIIHLFFSVYKYIYRSDTYRASLEYSWGLSKTQSQSLSPEWNFISLKWFLSLGILKKRSFRLPCGFIQVDTDLRTAGAFSRLSLAFLFCSGWWCSKLGWRACGEVTSVNSVIRQTPEGSVRQLGDQTSPLLHAGISVNWIPGPSFDHWI